MTNDQAPMSNEIPMTKFPIETFGFGAFIRHCDLDIVSFVHPLDFLS
jgi:hypothetical protein